MQKFIMGCSALFILGSLLACLCSGIWLGSGETDTVKALASFNTMNVQAGGVWNAPKTVSTYWNAGATLIGWNYPFLGGAWAFPIKFVLWIISIGFIFGLLELFFGVITSLVNIVRNFLPGA